MTLTWNLEDFWRSNVHVFIFGGHSNAGKKQAQFHNGNNLLTHILKYEKQMHLKHFSCFCDLDLLGALGIGDVSLGRNIYIWP